MKRGHLAILIVILVLVLDQWLKVWIKTHLSYGEEIKILGLDWARIYFIENKGMAFGWSWGGQAGKLALSLFRLLAAGFLIYMLRSFIKQKMPHGFILSFALILAGAVGNILDSAFYGLMFSASQYGQVAQWVPFGQGYAPFLMGKVVDMFYFPLITSTWPDWVPFVGGQVFQFFRPVFNVADSAITVGVASLLIFYRSFLLKTTSKNQS